MSEDQGDSGTAPAALEVKQRRKKPPTGRPRGRPRKQPEFLVPSQIRRTILSILSEEMEVNTPAGKRKVSKFHALFSNLVANAAKLNPTALNHLMRLLIPALEEREQAHGQVQVAELRRESEKPVIDNPDIFDQVIAQMNFARDKF